MNEEQRAHVSAVLCAAETNGGPLARVAEEASEMEAQLRGVVLVEGMSDRSAVETLAVRRGYDLAREGVWVVAIGGVRSFGQFISLFGPAGMDVRLAGLYDAGEERDVRRGLQRNGLGAARTRDEMAALGFHVCVADLEDELIRSLGCAAVEAVIVRQGELGAFRTMQRQPAQRERTLEAQLRRFMGTRGGRKIQYAPVLVDALDQTRVPAPLDGVLEHVLGPGAFGGRGANRTIEG